MNFFDKDTINDLIEGDHERLAQIQKRPSIIMSHGQSILPQLSKVIERLNPLYKAAFPLFGQDLGHLDADYFKAIGIVKPMPLQILCFNFCKMRALDSRHLI